VLFAALGVAISALLVALVSMAPAQARIGGSDNQRRGVPTGLGGSALVGAMAAPDRISEQGRDLLSKRVAANPDLFAGVSFHPGLATVHVAAGADSAAARAVVQNVRASQAVSEPLGAGNSWAVAFDAQARSLGRLQAVVDVIGRDQAWKRDATSALVEWGIDPDRNVVDVGVTGLSPAVVAAVRARFGDDVALHEASRAHVAVCSRLDDCPPYWAGAKIQNIDGINCTSGFGVSKGSSSYLLFAGHCYLLGSNVYDWGGDYMGTVAYKTVAENGYDRALIRASSGYQTYIGPYTSASARPISGYHTPSTGEYVCFSGAVSGENCSSPDSGNDICVYFSNADRTTCHLHRAASIDYATVVRKGDSGGPVYSPCCVNGHVKAEGIIIGYGPAPKGSTGGWVGYYHPTYELLQVWGVTLKTG
jgi:hypothetical protein